MFGAVDVMPWSRPVANTSPRRLLLRHEPVRTHLFPRTASEGILFSAAYSGLPGKCSVLPIKPDQLALDLDPVGRQDADFIGGIGRLQRNRGAAAAEALQGRFLLIDQRHHDIAGLGGLVTLDQRHVAVENPGIHHGIAAHLERVMFSGAEHVRWNADGVTSRLQRLDWRARGDAAHDRNGNRTAVIVLSAATDPAEGTFDHAGREATPTVTAAAG